MPTNFLYMTIQEYITQLNLRYKSGISREHSTRGDLQKLLCELLPDFLITKVPYKTDEGASDYILTKDKIPVGYIVAKDICGPDIEGMKKNKEQLERYKTGLSNLDFTDYLDFHVYRDGEFLITVAIAEIKDGSIVGLTENYNDFENIIKDFGIHVGQVQYIGNVPKKAWKFSIGGYQPTGKWLKDRRDRELSIDEIRHYQKITVALMETGRLMQEIDGIYEV
jgi:hypothetical protein